MHLRVRLQDGVSVLVLLGGKDPVEHAAAAAPVAELGADGLHERGGAVAVHGRPADRGALGPADVLHDLEQLVLAELARFLDGPGLRAAAPHEPEVSLPQEHRQACVRHLLVPKEQRRVGAFGPRRDLHGLGGLVGPLLLPARGLGPGVAHLGRHAVEDVARLPGPPLVVVQLDLDELCVLRHDSRGVRAGRAAVALAAACGVLVGVAFEPDGLGRTGSELAASMARARRALGRGGAGAVHGGTVSWLRFGLNRVERDLLIIVEV